MKKAIRQKLKLAFAAAMNDEAPLAEKARATRQLSNAIWETIDAIGPQRAGKLMRSIHAEHEAQHPPPAHESTMEELLELLYEIDRQTEQLN